jgi:hypothetical protein
MTLQDRINGGFIVHPGPYKNGLPCVARSASEAW